MKYLQRFPTFSLCVLGAVSALNLAPIDAWWVLFFTVPLALQILSLKIEQQIWRGFWLGWCFGFGYFLGALHWIGFAFLVDANKDLWMMPIALGGLTGFLALFWAAATMCALQWAKRGAPLWIALPVAFAVFEWFRSFLFTGFPWAVFGQAVDGMGGVAQLASLIGMNGLTLMVWLWAASFHTLWQARRRERLVALAVLTTMPLCFAWGEWHLASHPTQYVEGVTLRLVQPNISQSDKWRAGNARTIFDQLLALTAAPSSTGKPVTHIIWPESSVPFLIDESEPGRAEMAAALNPGQILLAGAVRRAKPDDKAAYFTSILIFNDKAAVLGHYDKWHLVPGGEFLPMAWLLEPLGLRKVVSLPESFTPGPGPTTLDVPGAGPAGMSICYEAIFPGALSDPANRPSWLVNVTNDGWFGKSIGPYQHLAQLRLRAIEQGLPVARAANTGVSAVIDSYGRMTFVSQLGTTGAFDLELPQSASPTIYAAWPRSILFVVLILTIGLGHWLKRR
jgi:apolipoprotein N-acyltransferase